MKKIKGPWPFSVPPRTSQRTADCNRMFPDMVNLLPAGTSGNVEIVHSHTSVERAYIQRCLRNEMWLPGSLCQLNIDGVGWMFDTVHEKWMNRRALELARGDFLIGGLGLGMILWPILRMGRVNSVTVLENNEDVMRLVLPSLDKHPCRSKLKIEHFDAREYPKTCGRQFDGIWLDCVPAYGYGFEIMAIQEDWINLYNPLCRQPMAVGHWGFHENLEWALRRTNDEDEVLFWDHMPIGHPHPLMADIDAKFDHKISGCEKKYDIKQWGVAA